MFKTLAFLFIFTVGLSACLNVPAEFGNLRPGAAPGGDIVQGLAPITRETWRPFRPEGMTLVSEPVRSGTQALRVELHAGDCGREQGGWDDCASGNERVELLSLVRWDEGTEVEIGWSVFVPSSFPSAFWSGQTRPEMFLGQFHGLSTGQLFPFYYGGWEPNDGGLNVKGPDGRTNFHGPFRANVVPRAALFDQWNDIMVRVRWTNEKDGYFQVFRNGQPVGRYDGPTLPSPTEVAYFKIGIYRLDTRTDAGVATVYYDNIYSKPLAVN